MAKKDVVLDSKHEDSNPPSGQWRRVVFNDSSLENPRTTWFVLSIVTLFAVVIGVFGVLSAPSRDSGALYYQVSNDTLSFNLQTTIIPNSESLVEAFAVGWNDELFLADRSGVSLYNASGEKLGFWRNDAQESPTAATFVFDEKAATNGTLLVAYTNTIKALRFSLETAATEDNGVTTYTARRETQNELETVLTVPDAAIRGLACTSERLFVADYATGRVWRYSWAKLNSLRETGELTCLPDCEIGAPDDATAYPGLRPGLERNFSLSFLPGQNELFVANSGLFRVDSFNVSAGVNNPSHSWTRESNTIHAFTGSANPIAVAVSKDSWLATADAGAFATQAVASANSPIQLFSLTGEWLGQIPYDGISRTEETFVVDLGVSPDARRIYALNSNGEIDVWTLDR